MERREFMGKQQKTTDRQIPKKKRRKASRFHMALALFIAIVVVSLLTPAPEKPIVDAFQASFLKKEEKN